MYSDTVSFRVYGWLLLSNGFFSDHSKKKVKKERNEKMSPFLKLHATQEKSIIASD
jgi:hypothetical protein